MPRPAKTCSKSLRSAMVATPPSLPARYQEDRGRPRRNASPARSAIVAIRRGHQHVSGPIRRPAREAAASRSSSRPRSGARRGLRGNPYRSGPIRKSRQRPSVVCASPPGARPDHEATRNRPTSPIRRDVGGNACRSCCSGKYRKRWGPNMFGAVAQIREARPSAGRSGSWPYPPRRRRRDGLRCRT